MGPSTFTKLFDIPLDDGYDDISGIDTINIVFDGAGNIDLANSRILVTDDSSAGNAIPTSGAFVLNLLGMVIETLDGPGAGTAGNFEDQFGEPTWRDAEGADYNEETGDITIFFSTSGDLPVSLVRFNSEFEVPPLPEPATFALIGLGLAAVALLRART